MALVPLTPLSFPERSAARRSARRGALQSRGRYERGVWYGPGSAQRHEECRSASGTRESCPSLQLQPDHAHQAVGHLLVAFEPRGMSDQKLAMIEIDQGLVVEHDLGQLLVERLALRGIGDEAGVFQRLVGFGTGIAAVVLRRPGVQEDIGVAVGIDAAAPADQERLELAGLRLLE